MYRLPRPPGEYDGAGPFVMNFVKTGQSCATFPDIGSIGNVVSVVLPACLSIVAVILVATLDCLTGAPRDQRIFPWSWNVLSEKNAWRCRRWKRIFTTFIIVTADTQALSGFALLLASFTSLPSDPRSNDEYLDGYIALVVYSCCVFSSTHIASLLVLRGRIGKHLISSLIRIILLSSFGIALCVAVDISRYAFEVAFVVLEKLLVERWHIDPELEHKLEDALPPVIMLVVYWNAIIALLRPTVERRYTERDERGKPSSTVSTTDKLWSWLEYGLLIRRPRMRQRVVSMVWEALGILQYSNPIAVFCSSPFVVFTIQLCSAIASVTFLLLQKLTNAPEPSMEDKDLYGIAQWCVLNNNTDNAWGFGQSCAVILLLLPIYAAVGEYLDLESTSERRPAFLRDGEMEKV